MQIALDRREDKNSLDGTRFVNNNTIGHEKLIDVARSLGSSSLFENVAGNGNANMRNVERAIGWMKEDTDCVCITESDYRKYLKTSEVIKKTPSRVSRSNDSELDAAYKVHENELNNPFQVKRK